MRVITAKIGAIAVKMDCDNGKIEMITATTGVTRGIRNLTFWGAAKFQSAPSADNPRYAAG